MLSDLVSARQKVFISVLAWFHLEVHKASSLSNKSAEIASCSNNPLRKIITVSHPDDEHGSSDIYTYNTILTDVVPL